MLEILFQRQDASPGMGTSLPPLHLMEILHKGAMSSGGDANRMESGQMLILAGL